MIPFHLFSPAMQEAMKPRYPKWLTPVAWRDDLPFAEELVIDASTWSVPDLFPDAHRERVHSPSGEFSYLYKGLPGKTPLVTCYGARRGRVWFTDPVHIPVLYQRDTMDVWMSVTLMEVFTLRPGVRFASGRVVLGGLGLGWQLHKIAAKKSVREIVVIEKSNDLLRWYGRKLCAQVPKVKAVMLGDVFSIAAKTPPRDDTKWILDVWDGYGDAYAAPELDKLRQQGHKVWAWGGSAYRTDRV
jgi:hypothetical protein